MKFSYERMFVVTGLLILMISLWHSFMGMHEKLSHAAMQYNGLFLGLFMFLMAWIMTVERRMAKLTN